MKITDILFSIVFIIVFFGASITWVLFVTRRFSPFVRQRLGKYLDVTIKVRQRFRNQTWEIKEDHTWQQGCLVSIVQAGVEYGCMVMSLFLLLAVLIGILMIASGG